MRAAQRRRPAPNTRAAIPCVAAHLHLEMAVFPQKCEKALARTWITVQRNAVDDDAHASSARICTASSRVIACRQSGSPCGSRVHASSGIAACAARSASASGGDESRTRTAHRGRGHRKDEPATIAHGDATSDDHDTGPAQRRGRQLAKNAVRALIPAAGSCIDRSTSPKAITLVDMPVTNSATGIS